MDASTASKSSRSSEERPVTDDAGVVDHTSSPPNAAVAVSTIRLARRTGDDS